MHIHLPGVFAAATTQRCETPDQANIPRVVAEDDVEICAQSRAPSANKCEGHGVSFTARRTRAREGERVVQSKQRGWH